MYPRGKGVKETQPVQKFRFWPRPEDVRRMEEKRIRLIQSREEGTDEMIKSDIFTDSSDLSNCGDVEGLNVTDAEIFATIFKKCSSAQKTKKCPKRKPKPSRRMMRKRKKPPSNHNISAPKVTYVITFMSALEFMRRNCVHKALRINPAATGALNNPPRRPSSLMHSKPPPQSQPNLRVQTRNIARIESTHRVLNLPPQQRTKCKGMFNSSSSSSPTRSCPHPRKKTLIPNSAMRQVHDLPSLLPETESGKRRSKPPSIEIQRRRPKRQQEMQNQTKLLRCRKENIQIRIKELLPK